MERGARGLVQVMLVVLVVAALGAAGAGGFAAVHQIRRAQAAHAEAVSAHREAEAARQQAQLAFEAERVAGARAEDADARAEAVENFLRAMLANADVEGDGSSRVLEAVLRSAESAAASDPSLAPEARRTIMETIERARREMEAGSGTVQPEQPAPPDAEAEDPRYVLGFTVERIDGTPEHLEVYKGKVVLFVNVASKCGLTPQYAGLEELYEGRKDRGLVVLGFPANNFREQEPGTNEEIAAFCSAKYGVTFPMFEKISVLGDDQHPLYKKLSEATEAPNWNFTKYLVDRNGVVVERFDPRTPPDDAGLLEAIDALLGP